uniref:Uncharacterized protein n=1 Tax=uncultured Armatimonadetes bacterium TaxID=157466 RepID=A0A6J4K422_9BACT|nr:hypothetical protein AVDCRST_MAG63-4717 [uncultured Armatimonadetes bacterium]
MTIGPVSAVRDPVRLAALARTRLLDSPAEASFDRLTRLAVKVLSAPVALVSLVDADRQFFKSQIGLAEPWAARRETPISHSFCQHVVASNRPLIVTDARNDPRVCDNPAVREMGVAAYLGVPLVTSQGQTLGSFCVMDARPRGWTDDQVSLLRDLADSVIAEIELRAAAQAAHDQARQAERERREKAALLEAADEGIIGVGPSGRATFANPAAVRLLGYTADELLVGDLHDLVHPRWQDGSPCSTIECPFAHAIQNGHRGLFEDLVMWRRDGEAFPAVVACSPVAGSGEPDADDKDGDTRSGAAEATSVVVSFRNVAERRRAEQRLRAQYAVSRVLSESGGSDGEATVPRLLDAIARGVGWSLGVFWRVQTGQDRLVCEGVWRAPAEHGVAKFLAATRRRTFGPGEGFPGRVWASGAPAWVDDVTRDARFVRASVAARSGLRGAFAFPVLGRSGVLGVMEFFSHDVRAHDPDLLEMVGSLGTQIGQFIERKQAEAAARESEAHKAAIVEASLDCIITMDRSGRITEFNPAAEATFGHRRDEVLGREMAETLLPPSLRQLHRDGLARYLATGDGPILGRRIEMTALRADGTVFPVDLTVTRLSTEGAPLFTGFVRDITGRKQAEAAREQLLGELRASAGALHDSEQLLRSVLRNVPLIVFALDRHGVFTVSEGKGLEALGLRGGEVVGRSVFDVYQDVPDVLENVRRALAGEITAWTAELAGMTYDTRCTLLRDPAGGGDDGSEDGDITGLIAVAFDITEQRRAEHVSRGQTGVLTRTLDALTTRPDLHRFLEQVLAAVAEQLRSPSAALVFHDADQGAASLRLVYDQSRVLPPGNAGSLSVETAPLLSQEPELWGELVRTRQPLVVKDVTVDHRVRGRSWLQDHEIRSLLLVPLLARDAVVGCLSIRSSEPRDFRPEERALARALAQQAMLAVELTRLAEHEQQAAVLEERNRLAGEIHDTLAQGFVGIVMQLDAAEEVLAREPEAARPHMARAHSLARTSLAEARRSVSALSPAHAARDEVGLPEAFARMVEEMASGWALKPRFLVEGRPHRLAAGAEHDLRRIGQEALTNALKHSRAQEIVVRLTYGSTGVRLSVRDNGRGFDADRPAAREGGFGLNGMHERARRIRADLSIRSAPGRGTKITVVFPGKEFARTMNPQEITHESGGNDPDID